MYSIGPDRVSSHKVGSDTAAIAKTNLPTVAFFGATGGCTLAALSHALEAGYYARALARTPAKLTGKLQEQGLTSALLDKKLCIVAGNAKDKEAVKQTLVDESQQIVSQIVFGIGAAPKFSANPMKLMTMDDPKVCQESMSTIVSALETVEFSGTGMQRPLVIVVSTTGLSKTRDVPIPLLPLYHIFLATPHADKKIMEERVVEAKDKNLVRDFVIVRPTLLIDGQQGRVNIDVGWEGKEPGKSCGGAAVGYRITREDVGFFIFEHVVATNGGDYLGKKVTLTSR